MKYSTMKLRVSAAMRRALWLAVAMLGISRLSVAEREATGEPLRVGIRLDEPFAEKAPGGGYKGYAIDLWESIAAQNGWKYRFVEFHSTAEILEAISQRKLDVGAANITVTRTRLSDADYLDPGQQLEIRNNRNPAIVRRQRGKPAARLRAPGGRPRSFRNPEGPSALACARCKRSARRHR